MNRYQITNQRDLRRHFWQVFPDMPRHRMRNYAGDGTMYCTDTRCAWCDWIDSLSRDGTISQELAQRATLD